MKTIRKMLTQKQAKVYRWMMEYQRENGYSPTIREVMQGMGFSSTNSLESHYKLLEKKGYIERKSKSARAIKFLVSELEILVFQSKSTADKEEL